MKKIALTIVLLVITSVSAVFSQTETYDVDGRYILIENVDGFFAEKENCMEVSEFYIRNFNEDESSKPLHVGVNALKNVIKFGIASGSEQFYMQRRCYIRLAKENYQMTFYKALLEMQVKAVVVDGEIMSPQAFYNYLLKS